MKEKETTTKTVYPTHYYPQTSYSTEGQGNTTTVFVI